MNYHRFITLSGYEMTVIDVRAFKRHRWLWKIRHNIVRLLTLWSMLLVISSLVITSVYA